MITLDLQVVRLTHGHDWNRAYNIHDKNSVSVISCHVHGQQKLVV